MTTDTDTFQFDRTFPLPPDQMWPLLTAADKRALWGAPDDGTVMDVLTTDLRVGGVERQRCGPAEAPEFEAETRWYNLAEPTDAVCTETIEAGGMALGTSLVTYRISEDGDGSAVSVTVAVTSFVGPEMIAEFKDGWTRGFAKIDALATATLEGAAK